MVEQLDNLFEILLFILAFLYRFEPSLSENVIGVYGHDLTHRYLVPSHRRFAFLIKECLEGGLPGTFEYEITVKTVFDHVLVLIQHVDQLLDDLRLIQNLFNLHVLILLEVNSAHQLLPLLVNVHSKCLRDWLQRVRVVRIQLVEEG